MTSHHQQIKMIYHFKTRAEKHIKKDNKSHIFKHLHSCFDSHNSLSFIIIDKPNSKFHLKIKEVLHINQRKPNINTQKTIWFVFCLSLSSIIFTISNINYQHLLLFYTSLLLHLIITHLANTFHNKYVIIMS